MHFHTQRGRIDLPLPHSLGSCGGETPVAGKGPNLTLPQACGALGWLGPPSPHIHPVGLLEHSQFEVQPALQPPPKCSATLRALEGT